ncbi:hypothetical protein THAOC_07083, partial [Thalassiosira oceanica]
MSAHQQLSAGSTGYAPGPYLARAPDGDWPAAAGRGEGS